MLKEEERERGGYIADETNIVVSQAVHDDVLGEVGNSDGIGDGGTESGRVVVTGRRHGRYLLKKMLIVLYGLANRELNTPSLTPLSSPVYSFLSSSLVSNILLHNPKQKEASWTI